MRVQVTVPIKDAKSVKEHLESKQVNVSSSEWGAEEAKFSALIDPGLYRVVHGIVQSCAKGTGSLDVLELNCQAEGEHNLEIESVAEVDVKPAVVETKPQPKSSFLSCSTCGGDFQQDRQLYRQHFKTDWHRYNLKMKGLNKPVIDQEAFGKLDQAELEKFLSTLTLCSDSSA